MFSVLPQCGSVRPCLKGTRARCGPNVATAAHRCLEESTAVPRLGQKGALGNTHRTFRTPIDLGRVTRNLLRRVPLRDRTTRPQNAGARHRSTRRRAKQGRGGRDAGRRGRLDRRARWRRQPEIGGRMHHAPALAGERSRRRARRRAQSARRVGSCVLAAIRCKSSSVRKRISLQATSMRCSSELACA